MVDAVRAVVGLPDPVGQVVRGTTRPNGLLIEQVREPLGVVAVVYEARPNVTVDVAALCLKSGNAAVLRGSSVAAHDERRDRRHHRRGADRPGRGARARGAADPRQLARRGDRAADRRRSTWTCWSPVAGRACWRPSASTRRCPSSSTATGTATSTWTRPPIPSMATSIIVNAKTSRPSVCNAAETLLVHEAIAPTWLPDALGELHKLGVVVRGGRAGRARSGRMPSRPPRATGPPSTST